MDDGVGWNIIGEYAFQLYTSAKNIETINDGLTRTSDFLKDMDVHMVRILDVTRTTEKGTKNIRCHSMQRYAP